MAAPGPSSPKVQLLPAPLQEDSLDFAGDSGPWVVILYNDDWHTIDQVALQVALATGYPMLRSLEITMEAHSRGRAIAYTGSREECERVAAVLRRIRLQVETDLF